MSWEFPDQYMWRHHFFFLRRCCAPFMRRHISRAEKEQLFIMSAYLTPSNIARVTNVSRRTVHRVLSLSLRTGSVEQRPLQAGRPRDLSSLDANVSHVTYIILFIYLIYFRSTWKLVSNKNLISYLWNFKMCCRRLEGFKFQL
jgi:hypothetical protein